MEGMNKRLDGGGETHEWIEGWMEEEREGWTDEEPIYIGQWGGKILRRRK